MGKALSGILSFCALGFLGVLLASSGGNLLQDAGLVLGFLALAVLAWFVALGTAVYRALRYGREARWVLLLIAFLWLPVLPAFCYGLTGLVAALTPRRRAATVPASVPAVVSANSDEVLLAWPHLLRDEVPA